MNEYVAWMCDQVGRSERCYMRMIWELGIARANELIAPSYSCKEKHAFDMPHALVSRSLDYQSIETFLHSVALVLQN